MSLTVYSLIQVIISVFVFSQWFVLLAAISSFGLIFALALKSRETPTNYILLACFVSVF